MDTNKIYSASAPGRMDVMGGIADYSGSLVLQMSIQEKTTIKIKLRTDYQCNLTSTTAQGETLSTTVDYRKFLSGNVVNISDARNQFNKENSWAAYIVGCALVLQHEKNISFTGANFEIDSSVPLGKGVSSSASLEVATMKALAEAFKVTFTGTELPVLAQKVENLVVGAPCGLMDQLATYFGNNSTLLPIICQPDIIKPLVKIPEGIKFFGIDSGVRHAVGGSSYTDVRCAAFMGYTIIAHSLGVTQDAMRNTQVTGDRSSLPYHGYLCNIDTETFIHKFKALLPEKMAGKEFIEKYGATIDAVTTVNPNVVYNILACTSHPVFENARVNSFLQHLQLTNEQNTDRNKHLRHLGQLMTESHNSYSHCGLGSDRTDEIVNLTKTTFPHGIYGAKITGGGSGGTVCILAEGETGRNSVATLHQYLQEKYQMGLTLFR